MTFIISTTGGTASNWLSHQINARVPQAISTHASIEAPLRATYATHKDLKNQILEHARSENVFCRTFEVHQDFPEYLTNRVYQRRLELDAETIAQAHLIHVDGKPVTGNVHGTTSPALRSSILHIGAQFGYLVRHPFDRALSKVRNQFERILSEEVGSDESVVLYAKILNSSRQYWPFLKNGPESRLIDIPALLNKLTHFSAHREGPGFHPAFRRVPAGEINPLVLTLKDADQTNMNPGERIEFTADELLLLIAMAEVQVATAADREFVAFGADNDLIRYEDITRNEENLIAVISRFTECDPSEMTTTPELFTARVNARPKAPPTSTLAKKFPSLLPMIEAWTRDVAAASGLTDFYTKLGYDL